MNQFALVGIFENYKKVLIAVFPSKLEAEIAQNLLEDTLSETVYEDYQIKAQRNQQESSPFDGEKLDAMLRSFGFKIIR